MIHHVSIAAAAPAHVAAVLAELMGGECYPFPGPLPGAYMAVSGDRHGTLVEVFPADTVLKPGYGNQPAQFFGRGTGTYAAFHFLLSVPLEQAEIEEIGKGEGWRTRLVTRGAEGQPGSFQVIECWIENRILIELAPRSMIAAYQDAMQLATLDAHFSNRKAA